MTAALASSRRGRSRMGPGVRLWMLFEHTAVLLGLWLARLTGRFIGGRVLLSHRATDATFMHQARHLGGGWWASRAGWVRSTARLSPLLLWVGWIYSPVWTIAAGLAAIALSVRWGVARYREREHERRWVEPLWPAIVEILGQSVADAPPRSWIDFPLDPAALDAEIVVSLPDRSVSDCTRAASLRDLFTERLELGPWIEHVEPQSRMVIFRHRPQDPPLWAPVARLFQLDPAGSPDEWIDMPPDIKSDDAEIRVNLPADSPDDTTLAESLARIADQRLPKKWAHRLDHESRVCLLVRRPPERKPPEFVTLTDGEFPEIDELLAGAEFDDFLDQDFNDDKEKESA